MKMKKTDQEWGQNCSSTSELQFSLTVFDFFIWIRCLVSVKSLGSLFFPLSPSPNEMQFSIVYARQIDQMQFSIFV